MSALNKTLWARIKNKYHRGSSGGPAGVWSARKAQLAVKEYKSKGGKYPSTRKSPTNSLVKWTREDWNYIDEKHLRYLPKSVRDKLSAKEKAIENKRKKKAISKSKKTGKIVKAKYSKSVLLKMRRRPKTLKKKVK